MSDGTARCVTCGAEFQPSRSDTKYCGQACRQQALRDRTKSDAIATVGGLQVPVTGFSAESGSFGTVGRATVEVFGLRGDPKPDRTGRIPIELAVPGRKVWVGDCQRIERACASGAITLTAAGPESRLAAQRWGPSTWESLSAAQLATGVARRAGLVYTPPEQPLDPRPLGSTLDIDGTSNALELLLAASREAGCEFSARDNTLIFGPANLGEPRTIEASDAKVTRFGDAARVAVVVRSRMSTIIGGGTQDKVLSTGRVADVPAAVPVYIVTVYNRRQIEIDALHEQLTCQLAASLVTIETDVDDSTLYLGDLVRIDTLGDLTLRVVRVEHRFTVAGGLKTCIKAMHLPALPSISNALPNTLPAKVVAPWAAAA